MDSQSRVELLQTLLDTIIQDTDKHARFINAVSYLENCGARKIAACEHPTLVREEILKHASEEFRHAHYLKKQIGRITEKVLPDYSLSNIVGGFSTLHYLNKLDIFASRYLQKTCGFSKAKTIDIAYLLVTYAIELRAEEFYPVYHDLLRKHSSKITVKSILLEEEEHLEEMRRGIDGIKNGYAYAEVICSYEETLYSAWLQHVYNEICSPVLA